MALEDRVKQLEDELKVLKNEIQATLLDIQEQVLSHYYPSLYPSLNTEVSRPTAAVNHQSQEQQCPQQKQQCPQQEENIHTISPSNDLHARYKTKTITLAEDTETEDQNDGQNPDELDDSNREQTLLASGIAPSSKNGIDAPLQKNSNGLSPERQDKKRKSPHRDSPARNVASLDKKLYEENNEFFESLHQLNLNEELEEDVSFDELGEILRNNLKNSEYHGDPITGKILDDMFNESLPFMAEEETLSGTGSLNSQAVKLTVRKLLSWIDESVALIGKARTRQAVEMYVRAGDLSPQMHETLIMLVNSNNEPPPFRQANIRQIIDTLSKLNDILDHHTPEYLVEVMNFISEVNYG